MQKRTICRALRENIRVPLWHTAFSTFYSMYQAVGVFSLHCFKKHCQYRRRYFPHRLEIPSNAAYGNAQTYTGISSSKTFDDTGEQFASANLASARLFSNKVGPISAAGREQKTSETTSPDVSFFQRLSWPLRQSNHDINLLLAAQNGERHRIPRGFVID